MNIPKIPISKLGTLEPVPEEQDNIPTYQVISDPLNELSVDTIEIKKPMILNFSCGENYGTHSFYVKNIQRFEINNLTCNGNIYLLNSTCTIRNSNIKNPADNIDYILFAGDESKCIAEDCKFSNTKIYGIGADNFSECQLTNCEVVKCSLYSITITGYSSCNCNNVLIDGGTQELITVENNSLLLMKECTLLNATTCAIFLFMSSIVAQDCIFKLNGKGALSIRESIRNMLINCQIIDSNDTAVLLENGDITIEGTTITGCNGNGINAQLASRAVVYNCTFSNTKWPLAAFCDKSTGIIRDTLFEISEMSGLIVRGESNVNVQGCTIRKCAEAGIRISDTRSAKFSNCIIADCQYSGIEVTDNSTCQIQKCIFAGGFEIAINVYSTGFASVSDSAVFGPFKSVVWTHYGGNGNFSNMLIDNLSIPLQPDSIQAFAGHANILRQLDTSNPIIETFTYSLNQNENKKCEVNDERFFRLDTKWFVSVTNCFIVGVGHYELIANPGNHRNDENSKQRIPAKCLKCGNPAIEFHFSPCGHCLYCHECFESLETKPTHCPICHLPIEKGVQSVNCGGDDDTCAICYDAKVDTIILPCGHTICRECSNTWFKEATECPFCRESRVQPRALVSYE
ncbi:hypothetical protein TRFO_34885 [Tritrichomonas foetus]|uniref:RING-type domain-containing protein n=1 Tax=Tritrichomonas foetus TaxID=1144522 RepID=A0A1J4JJ98_9EUKA|nr:hypothetical protein TRFO_34885 [Tritrichomonas foetus]|eukprot:OHS98665.1 hypothetical protein TRFO_34885 [Tritrichomonas foetus]